MMNKDEFLAKRQVMQKTFQHQLESLVQAYVDENADFKVASLVQINPNAQTNRRILQGMMDVTSRTRYVVESHHVLGDAEIAYYIYPIDKPSLKLLVRANEISKI